MASANESEQEDTAPLRDTLKEAKQVAWFSALITTWINLRIEVDKTLIALSAAGVGVLVTLLSTTQTLTHSQLWITALALGAFCLSICCVLSALDKSTKYITLINQKDVLPTANTQAIKAVTEQVDKMEQKLKYLDSWARGFFYCGLLLSAVLGILMGVGKLPKPGAPSTHAQSGKSTAAAWRHSFGYIGGQQKSKWPSKFESKRRSDRNTRRESP